VTHTEANPDEVWLTKDAYDKLQAEVAHLKGPIRTELSRRIAEARDEGDLRENGGYQAAKEEQGKVEARIRQLEIMLEKAQMREVHDAGVVQPGTRVTVTFEGDDETVTFLLGSREMIGMDPAAADLTVYSPQSPMGAALMGKTKGTKAEYEAPNGKKLSVKVVDVKPF
jgi:transcription elongation factor GreA